MCASLLRQYHIRAVYFGCANERFGGTEGVLKLHEEYVHSKGTPFVTGKANCDCCQSLDRSSVPCIRWDIPQGSYHASEEILHSRE